MKSAAGLAAVAGALLVAVAAVGCGGGSESRDNSATTTSAAAVKREIPQPPSNLTFAYGFADTTCGSQGLTFEHYGVEQEVFVCIGSELPELKGKAPCFVGQPSPDTTGANMVGQYDVNTKSVVPGGSWPQPCAATFASMLQWYYHEERGTLRQATPEPSTNPAPAEAPPGESGVLQVKRNDSLTCYSTSQKYTFPNGESALVGICDADDGAQTCASYQQSSGRVVTLGFPGSPWQPECLAARRMVESYKDEEAGSGSSGGASTAPAASGMSRALAYIQSKGFYAPCTSGVTPEDQTKYELRVVVGFETDTCRGMRAFFFVGDRFVGTDVEGSSGGFWVKSQSNREVVLAYALYKPDDAACCPSGNQDVRFVWDGKSLRRLDPLPPADARRGS